VYIFASLKASLRPEIAAMSTLMLVLRLIVLGVAALILRRVPAGGRRPHQRDGGALSTAV
jgi:ABC-type spermidine/putrescine transport system permease subunit II